MVFMKKGATPSKTPQLKKGKKAVQVKEESDDEMDFDGMMDDSDDDMDSDEAPQQKTPANKGAKGRQSMSEKKVSFSIPGKNSPAVKTPKKDNSILVKKQPTPANKGKTAMKEFKGMKGNNQIKKEMNDDDDDDEDDDDFDVEEGDEDDDLDLDDLDEGDEEDDDDDDDDEDDEDDDDDEEEEGDQGQANIKKKLALLKQNNVQQNKQKTPVKGNDKAKNAESPKEKSPKKEPEQKSSPKKNPAQVTEELERRRERDARMLFVGGLPNDIKAEELKALSSDIIDVSLPFHSRKHQAKTMFGFLCFDTEAKAESNYKSLQSKKLRGQPLALDFVGLKSKNKKMSEDAGSNFNMKKLFVSGMPIETTIDKIAKHFPLAYQIAFNQSPLFRTATISFNSEEEAKASYESKKEIELSGHKLVVLYSKQSGGSQSKKRKHNRKVSSKNLFAGGMNKNSSFGGKNKNNTFGGKNNTFGGNPAKKMKFMKKSAAGDEE